MDSKVGIVAVVVGVVVVGVTCSLAGFAVGRSTADRPETANRYDFHVYSSAESLVPRVMRSDHETGSVSYAVLSDGKWSAWKTSDPAQD